MPLFRILHASDPHMAAVSSLRPTKWWRQVGHNPKPLEAFVKFAHQNQTAFDAVLVSGDLSTSGHRADLDAAYRLYTAQAANATAYLTPTLEPTLAPWANAGKLDLLPGNHDRFRSSKQGYRAGGTVFDSVFCPQGGMKFWRAGQGVAHGISVLRGKSVLHVVKADFTLPRHDKGKRFYWIPGWFGQGRVDQAVLNNLGATTQAVRTDYVARGWNPVTLWAIHFDPFTTDQTLLLLGSEKLLEAARALKIPAILCGHTHESKVKPLSEETFVYACGTTAQAGAPQWECQAIEVVTDDNGVAPPAVRVVWYRYHKGQFSFLGSR